MNKVQWVALLVIIFGIIAGCIDEKSSSQADLEGATYTGVIPCADCQGIAYKLSLKKDHRFETSSVYIGKSNRAFTERGNWIIQGDSLLILNESEENARKFKMKNNQLVMLDLQGNEVSGSLSKMYVLNEADSTGMDRIWHKHRNQGTDFHATGTEPFWGLDMDFDNMITFKTANGDSISTPVPAMVLDTTTRARAWKTDVEAGLLKVELYPTGCVNDMSGEVFTHLVHVTYGDKTYSGCGSFINEIYKLNDLWILQTLDDKKVGTTLDGDTPALQFNVAGQKVYGNTGCNRLSGTIAVGDSSLTFSKMITTKMACRNKMELESNFLHALQKVDTYSIANARLMLMNKADTLMVFGRVD